ncbi:UNVERIFIED_CONTAM: hypothetical protein RKD43_002915 [Streptomyces graminofaciens]
MTTEPQGAQVVPAARRVVEQRPVQGRRAGQHGDPFRGDVREDGLHVEDGLRDHRGAAGEAGDDARLVAEGVEERVHDQVAVTLAQPGELAPQVVAAQGLGVGDDRALGAAGGAGGEDEIGGVVGGDGGGALPHLPGVHAVAAGEEVLPGPVLVRRALGQDDDLLQVGQFHVAAAQGGDVGGAEEGAGDEEEPGP